MRAHSAGLDRASFALVLGMPAVGTTGGYVTAHAAPALRKAHIVEMRFTDTQWAAIQSAALQHGYGNRVGEWLATLAIGQIQRGLR